MDSVILSSIIKTIIQLTGGYFGGKIGKVRLFFIKKKLKKDVFNEILQQYGNEIFYNDFDYFLTKHDVISNIIKNCIDCTVFEYKSANQTVEYYVQLFIDQHPKYRLYALEMKRIIQKYFEIIYNTLNRTKSEETRIICNTVKEFSNELSVGLEKIEDGIGKANRNILRVEGKIDDLLNNSEEKSIVFSKDKYWGYLLNLCASFDEKPYIQRKLYSKDKDEEIDSLKVLLMEKRVVVLGEAGFGKTYESIALLKKCCESDATSDLIPIYLPLREYGLLYLDIIEGIKNKIGPFLIGNLDEAIKQWLTEGKFILILDGIDDIGQGSFREKFVADINHISAQYNKIYIFFTARFNQYYGELGEKKRYHLTSLNRQVIWQELRNEGIIVDIPNSYYELFSNPFFLSIGKIVLKQRLNYDIFNRSRLFEELFQELYGGIEKKKGLVQANPIMYNDALKILGRFSYETFSQPLYSSLEFDEGLSGIISENKMEIVTSFISSGLFKVTDHVVFVHKLIKEYCTAYYLMSQFPLSTNIELYEKLIEKDSWKEVFVFMGGLFKDSEAQDEFLDFVMLHNLPLYVECVKAKSDVIGNYQQLDSDTIAKRLLTQIRNSYTFIILHYFKPILKEFDPVYPDDRIANQNVKIRIVGCLSKDKKYLDYWFDTVLDDVDVVKYIDPQDLQMEYAEYKRKALLEGRTSISSYGTNLYRSGLQGDTGRKISIDLIKRELKKIIEKRKLIESNYLLCEKIAHYQKKLKDLEGVMNLSEMRSMIDKLIQKELQRTPDMVGFSYNGVEIFPLQKLLYSLQGTDLVLSDYVLPGSDIDPSKGNVHFVWDLYSKEQKEKRMVYFFYYHELSYLEMVKTNFPELYKYFSRYNNAPYQVIIQVDYKESAKKDFFSEPSIQYYYIASQGLEIPLPIVNLVEENSLFKNYESILKEIHESYQKQGRTIQKASITGTGFTAITTSRRTGTNEPLSDYVYESIKESLAEIFGSFT